MIVEDMMMITLGETTSRVQNTPALWVLMYKQARLSLFPFLFLFLLSKYLPINLFVSSFPPLFLSFSPPFRFLCPFFSFFVHALDRVESIREFGCQICPSGIFSASGARGTPNLANASVAAGIGRVGFRLGFCPGWVGVKRDSL